MNACNFYGRLTKDVTVVSNGEDDVNKMVARTTLAVNRSKKVENTPDADYIPLVFFGKKAKAAAQYLQKGNRLSVCTHVQTGSYEKDGKKIYTTDFIVDSMDFVESKNDSESSAPSSSQSQSGGFKPNPAAVPSQQPSASAQNRTAVTQPQLQPKASQPSNSNQPPVQNSTSIPNEPEFSSIPDEILEDLPWAH